MVPPPQRGLWRLVWIGLGVRCFFVGVGMFVDGLGKSIDYTDVDYLVLHDAAALVARGASPYGRTTYRYTPVFAYLLLPDVLLGTTFIARLLFSAFDVALGVAIFSLLRRRGLAIAKAHQYALYGWMLNPLAVNICTRGSLDAVVAGLVAGALLLALRAADGASPLRDSLACGAVLGLGAHVKIYPAMHVLAVLVFFVHRRAWRKAAACLSGSAISFVVCTAACCWIYGGEYVEHAVVYHVTRRDHRHNFSAYWFPMYLAGGLDGVYGGVSGNLGLALVPLFLTAFTLVAATIFVAPLDLPLAVFAQTLLFVAGNKVCTAQYFVWWAPFALVVVAPAWPTATRETKQRLVGAALRWLTALALWLFLASLLEFRGINVLAPLWAATLVFYAANLHVLTTVVQAIGPRSQAVGHRPKTTAATAAPSRRRARCS
ncbi:PIG-M-domain-containing protein [Pelagophyceae sp. CCMP2097]|nr:PIG-M-domain-containing protein [Pelagophyceae sp. CCMP2097]